MTLMRGEGEEYKRRQKENTTSMYKKVKADGVFESSCVAILRHEQQGQVNVEIAGFPQVPRGCTVYSTLIRVQTGILLKQVAAIAMMMSGMEAIQRQGGKKEELKCVASKMQKTNAKWQAKKMIQVCTPCIESGSNVWRSVLVGVASMSHDVDRETPASVDLKGGWRCNLWD